MTRTITFASLALLACSSSSSPEGHPMDAAAVTPDAAARLDMGAVGHDMSAPPDAAPDAPAAARDTWTSFAQGFFTSYCTRCHSPGGQGSAQDFRDYAMVVASADAIRCGVAPMREPGCGSSPSPRQFPIGTGPHPTDAERARIVAWIDDGTPR